MAWQHQQSTSACGSGANICQQQFDASSMPNIQSMTTEQVRYCAEQAAQHAARCPGDPQAAQAAVWWQQRLTTWCSAAPPVPHLFMPAGSQPQASVPTQATPVSNFQVPASWVNNHGSMERRQIGHFTAFHTPTMQSAAVSRAATPTLRSPRTRIKQDLDRD